ncbi:MAG: hypothetical protein ACI9OU_002379 [Candidatus Promineifilaceae bacterium]|jgi:hypothetical protein
MLYRQGPGFPEVQRVTHGSRLAEMRGRMAEEAAGPGEPEGRIGKAFGGSPQGPRVQSSAHSTAWNTDPTVSSQP